MRLYLDSSALDLAADPASVTVPCWDKRFWRAAQNEGCTMVPGAEPPGV